MTTDDEHDFEFAGKLFDLELRFVAMHEQLMQLERRAREVLPESAYLTRTGTYDMNSKWGSLLYHLAFVRSVLKNFGYDSKIGAHSDG